MAFKEKLTVTLELDDSDAQGKLRQQVSSFEAAAKSVDTSTKKIERDFNRLGSASAKSAQGFKSASRNMGQLGLQAQDVAVQFQTGTNAMVILAQQGPQIASIFGPGGAVLGAFVAIGAVLTSVFVPSLLDSADASEKLEETLEALDKVLTKTKTGTKVLTDEIISLAKASRAVAELEINRGLVLASRAFNEARDAFAETLDDSLGSLTIGFDQAVKQAARLESTGLGIQKALDLGDLPNVSDIFLPGGNAVNLVRDEIEKLEEDFNLTRRQAVDFFRALGAAENSATVENLNALEETIARIGSEARKTSPEFVEFAATLAEQVRTAKDALDTQRDLEKILGNMDEALRKATLAGSDYAKELREIANTRAAENDPLIQRVEAEQRGQEVINRLLKEEIKDQETVKKQLRDLANARAAANDPLLERVEAQARGEEVINRIISERVQMEERLDELRLNENLQNQELFFSLEVTQETENIRDPFEKQTAQEQALHEERLRLIEAAGQENLGLQQRVNAALEAEEQRHQDVIRSIKIAELSNNLHLAGSLLGSLSQVMNSENKKQFEIGKKAAIASAVIHAAGSVLRTMDSLPYPANLVAAASVAAQAAVQVRTIKSQQFGGGGSVSASIGAAASTPTLPENPIQQGGRSGQVVFDFSVSVRPLQVDRTIPVMRQ